MVRRATSDIINDVYLVWLSGLWGSLVAGVPFVVQYVLKLSFDVYAYQI